MKVRSCSVAGQFYPRDPHYLEQLVAANGGQQLTPLQQSQREVLLTGLAIIKRLENDPMRSPLQKALGSNNVQTRRAVVSVTAKASNLEKKLKDMAREIAEMARDAAAWLERRALFARTVTIKVRYSDFTTVTRSHSSPRRPTASSNAKNGSRTRPTTSSAITIGSGSAFRSQSAGQASR